MKDVAGKHIQGNILIYFIVIMFFVIGISSGAFTVKALSATHKQELIGYLKSFFQLLSDNEFEELAILKQSLLNNLQSGALIWILGVTVIGIPLILLLIAVRGFIIGFTVGFLVENIGLKGFLFSLVSIVPQNLFIIPGLIIIAVIAISFSTMVIKNRLNKTQKQNIFSQFVLYSMIIFFLFLIIGVGCIVEAYITPIFMKMISSYM
ncbi:MAG: stage II sporulation protein M [Bacillota bacterium]